MAIVTVGIDLAKNVFAVHGVDETGKAVLVKPKMPRAKLMELIADLAPYRMSGKRGKNDAADAAAICEAVTRPTIRFVAVKSIEQQSQLFVHRTPSLSSNS